MAESFRPPVNMPGKTFVGRLTFRLRPLLDLQMATLIRFLLPWLGSRSGKVLEVGCGGAAYRQYLPDGCEYQGIDWSGAADVFGYQADGILYFDGEEFPLPANSFDNLFHTEVLEHIPNPEKFLQQCNRVLMDGGALFFSVPFQARYHYIPYDYWRFTPSSLKILLEKTGFTEINIVERGDDITVATYKVVSLFYRLLLGSWPEKLCGVLLSPIAGLCLAIAQLSSRASIGSRDDCLGYCVTAVKVST